MDNVTTDTLNNCLCSILPTKIANGMMSKLVDSINSYQTGQYEMVILSSGKFVEFALRALDFLLKKTNTQFSEKLPNFADQRLNEFATGFKIEPYKTLIPRALFSMYCIRNKCGGIHVATSRPSRLDATKLICDMKWVIYEFISTTHNFNDEDVIIALENLSAPLSQIVWDVDDTKRVLSSNHITCSEQILLLLCSCDSMSIDKLRVATEYKNITRFKNTILALHKQRFINCHNSICTISPLGVKKVEGIIKKINEENV